VVFFEVNLLSISGRKSESRSRDCSARRRNTERENPSKPTTLSILQSTVVTYNRNKTRSPPDIAEEVEKATSIEDDSSHK